jgi:DNA polymerase III alpha subunit (gram-positive type)
MLDVMVDIETTGTDPSINAMIQLAAIRFNWHTGEIDTENMFNLCLEIPGNRYWAEDTRGFWRSQPDVLESIMIRAQPAAWVMQKFNEWCGVLPLRMWAKPISFEWPFIQSYAKQFHQELPFHFRDAIDLQSFIRGTRQNPGAKAFDKEVPFDGPAHDAIFDVIHQIAVVFEAKKRFGSDVQDDGRPAPGTEVRAECPAAPEGGAGEDAVRAVPEGAVGG